MHHNKEHQKINNYYLLSRHSMTIHTKHKPTMQRTHNSSPIYIIIIFFLFATAVSHLSRQTHALDLCNNVNCASVSLSTPSPPQTSPSTKDTAI